MTRIGNNKPFDKNCKNKRKDHQQVYCSCLSRFEQKGSYIGSLWKKKYPFERTLGLIISLPSTPSGTSLEILKLDILMLVTKFLCMWFLSNCKEGDMLPPSL
jgi:hypothetical protein